MRLVLKKSPEENQAIGRSVGGLSTKIHTKCDALGNPTAFYLTPGQVHDLDGAEVLLEQINSMAVLADKAYDADERFIEKLAKQGCQAVVPPKANRIEKRDYDRHLYKSRHLIENFFAKLKQFRGIATRYDKLAENFLGAIYLAASIICLA
jgi:transposase